jgi:hypothetical protein
VPVYEVDGQFIIIDEFFEEGIIDDLLRPQLICFFSEKVILLLAHDDLIAKIGVIVIAFLELWIFKLFHWFTNDIINGR